MAQRVDYIQQSPQLFKIFMEFNPAAKESTIEEKIRDLVAIRASQIDGCGLCLDTHVKQAKIQG
jgi:AhpD family alkylhydroperoxidase